MNTLRTVFLLMGFMACVDQTIQVDNRKNILPNVPLNSVSKKEAPLVKGKATVVAPPPQTERLLPSPQPVVGGVAPWEDWEEQGAWDTLPAPLEERPPLAPAAVPAPESRPTAAPIKNTAYLKGYDEKVAWEMARRLDPTHPAAVTFTAWFTYILPVRCGGTQSRSMCHACVSQVLRQVRRSDGSGKPLWPPRVMDGSDPAGPQVNAWPYARRFADVLNAYPAYLNKLSLKAIHKDIPRDKFGEPDLTLAPVGTIVVYEHGKPGHIEVLTQPGGRRGCSDFCSKPRNLRGKNRIIGMYIPVR